MRVVGTVLAVLFVIAYCGIALVELYTGDSGYTDVLIAMYISGFGIVIIAAIVSLGLDR